VTEATVAAADLYGATLRCGGALLLRDAAGGVRPLPLDAWLDAAGAVDERVLARARGPVLDVGCGPGRHVHALARCGVLAVGVDVSPVAVALARRRGATVLEASIFDRLPGAGRWRSALLLDGNIGIGGLPAALLERVAALLRPGGEAIVETDPPGSPTRTTRVRIESDGAVSDWFAWARVAADAIAPIARQAGLEAVETFEDEARWFVRLVSS
jgi:SAM-dependent methyltransferase